MPIKAVPENYEVVPLWGPYLTDASETSITVNWRTENATNGTVFYATEEYFDNYESYNMSIDGFERELHHVQLNGLSPNTTYHYRVLIGEKYTADHTFTTFGSDCFTFIVYGDSQEQFPSFTQLERHKFVADSIAAESDVSFILHCGDLVGDVDNAEEWDRFFEVTRSALAEIPIFPVLGNHEGNSSNYYEFFGVSEWYSFDCGNAHFAMLDSNLCTAIQAEWLVDDLSVDSTFKFAVFHHPLYSSTSTHWGGWLDLRDDWEPVFIDNGVTSVFNGHVHAYERCYENGIHYAVLGIGGGPCYLLAEEKIDGYCNSFENTLGYARVTVNGNEAYMEIIKVADVSGYDVTYVYPQNTIFETISLTSEQLSSSSSLVATANLILSSVGIEVDRDSIDYGDVVAGRSSAVETVGITNMGNTACNVSLQVVGSNAVAQEFYEQSMYIDGIPYAVDAVIAGIAVEGSENVDTQLQVPVSWTEDIGLQEASLIFWAEAS
ncbi:MAG: metallophosphoesterase family protein [Candidatus Bathyarchaeota archaeon]|nr:metallophosphoesterase family protein [Candidatus Bathyarchaeota archaeon]